jgi:predicted PurR-regulated permease PerM
LPEVERMSDSIEGGVRAAPPDRRSRVRRRRIGWTNADVIRTAALVMGMYLFVRLLWFAHLLFLVAFLGVLFGLAVSSGVDRLERLRIPRGVGAPAIVIAAIGALVLFGAWLAPTIHQQSVELERRLPDALERADTWISAREGGVAGAIISGLARETPADSAHAAAGGTSVLRQRVIAGLGGVTRFLFPFLSSTIEFIASIIIIVFLSIYIAVDPDLYHNGMMALLPSQWRARGGEVLSAIATVLRKWFLTQLLAMITLGVITTVILMLLDVKSALALGLLAGLLEFIPTIGPIISSFPAIAMGFLDSPEKALWVLVAYLAVHFVESHALIPLLMKGGIDLPPVLTILAQALMALLLGFIGLMCAVPLVAAATVAVRMLYVERVVNDLKPV